MKSIFIRSCLLFVVLMIVLIVIGALVGFIV